jgi:hypothetical protein
MENCRTIPEALKERLVALRQRRDTASGGKKYWADTCRTVGLYEEEDGIWLSVSQAYMAQLQQGVAGLR